MGRACGAHGLAQIKGCLDGDRQSLVVVVYKINLFIIGYMNKTVPVLCPEFVAIPTVQDALAPIQSTPKGYNINPVRIPHGPRARALLPAIERSRCEKTPLRSKPLAVPLRTVLQYPESE